MSTTVSLCVGQRHPRDFCCAQRTVCWLLFMAGIRRVLIAFPAACVPRHAADRYTAQLAGLMPTDPWASALAEQAFYVWDEIYEVRNAYTL